jgi:hypothetical protein
VAFGFDVAVDRSNGATVAAWRDTDGNGRIEVDQVRPGASWIPGRLAELADRWSPVAVAYDATGPALDVADQARRAGVELAPVTGRDYAAACLGLLEAVVADVPSLRHRRNPDLDAAAAAAVRRPSGDAWVWGRRQSTESLAPLTAATLALWAFDHAPASLGDFRVY